ncbi:A/G-specific adenine glycosylase [Pseudidiomarina homiensis]|uniref:A/G-specific adenine glycosylase n=1 Tax=Pseudidiomarina homiensis TaxID=364198 RepID=UPI001F5467C0|nr:A/G-specific adenine glycosylase [Pseudidiomarina homiensis]
MVDFSTTAAKTVIPAKEFAKIVVTWQQQHGRNDLPWQQHNDPYHVLVSELMLQQTQVTTVIPYFERWLQRFPDVTTLAAAEEQEVMAHWQGLGYYRRARNLHAAAKTIVADYAAQIPEQAVELREIPGIGPYTVGAIRSFAFNAPAAIVDGNVKRLFARLFMLPYAVNHSANDRYFWELAEHYTPTSQNRRFAQGLLDLGATICKPKQPLCHACPLQSRCRTYANACVEDYPKRKQKKAIPTKTGHFLLAINRFGVCLEQRPANGIWPSLWCLPEVSQAPDAELGYEFNHTFSHYKLAGKVWLAEPATTTGNLMQVPYSDLADYGLPAPIRKLLAKIDWDEVCNTKQ